LEDAELYGAQPGGEGLGFEAVGAAQALLTTLVGSGLEDGGAFLHHGFVDGQAEAFGKAGGAFGSEELLNSVQKMRLGLVGHL